MRAKQTLMTLGLGLLVAASGYSQTPNPSQSTSPTQPPNSSQNPDANRAPAPSPDPTASASEKTFEGRLLRIDAATKTISMANLNGKEGGVDNMSFKYDDHTVIVGGDKTVQGLTGKTGSQLRITYQADHDSNTASRIEIIDNAQ